MVYNAILKEVDDIKGQSNSILKMKEELTRNFRDEYTRDKFTVAATLLDPVLRDNATLFTQEERTEALELIEKMIVTFAPDTSTESSMDVDQPVHMGPSTSASLRSQYFVSDTVPTRTAVKPKKEIEDYLLDVSSPNELINEYWFSREKRFTGLSMAAKAILSCPATSESCERLFSKAGFIVGKRATVISPENLEIKLFYHSNFDLD